MRLANPAGLAVLALALPVVLLHMLRPRRPSVDVSSTYLWREIARPVSAATPWQPPRITLPLVLQLAAVAALAVAAARPVRETPAPLARHTVFVIDVSASMGAAEGRPDRLGSAKAEARSLRRQVPQGGVASVVVAGAQPRVVVSASADSREFDGAVDALRVEGGRADFASAFTLAESLESPGAPVGFLLLSDGGLNDDERRLVPPGTRYVRIGREWTNAAVRRVVVQARGSGMRAYVTVANTGRDPIERTLRIDVEGRTARTLAVRLDGGDVIEREADLPSGERVVAALEGGDLLASDDRAYAVASTRQTVRVLVAGPEDVYLDRLLAAIPGVRVERSAVSRPGNGFDLAVYDGVAVPSDAGVPFLAIAPPGGAPGVRVTGDVQTPAVTLVRGDDPLLDGLDLSEVAIAKAQRLDAPGDEVLVAAESAPLLVRGTRRGRPFAYLAFALRESNLPLQLAFPVLGDRLVAELAGVASAQPELRPGEPVPIAAGQAASVRGPGTDVRVDPGAPAPVASRAGFWTVTEQGRAARLFAVNAVPGESSLRPAERIPSPPRPRAPGERAPKGERPLVAFLVAAVLALVGAELWVSRRVTGVPRRRRRAALGLRGVMAAALVLAAAGVSLPRQARRVATLFVVDASDSMGASGRHEAFAWVREALARQPRDALAGVAAFGGDARMELVVQPRARLVEPAALVDASRTDLAGALRLARAVLPTDARRRVVVVSDGRTNHGDAGAEIRRLRDAGVRVDVHPITRGGTEDVAVERLDVPARAGEGESLDVRATIRSSVAQTVRLTLRRDDAVVEERVLDVPAGATVVDLPQPPASQGIHRFRIDVSAAADGAPQNDTAYGAVRVTGPPRVLVAEGAAGEARELTAALRASGLQVDVVAAAQMPPAERLADYRSVVLVDVDAAGLPPEQTHALAAAVRDLGVGLVTIGGERAYGLGGYLGSELERVLPVTSEIKDPKRRASVAEVLAIDTSGSMGACHCNPEGPTGFGGDRRPGGVNKTDISRAGAQRAIQALQGSDQVGVLAFNTEQRWVVPLQRLPAAEVVERGLRGLSPAGGTNVHASLREAGQALRSSKAKLKHVILFTDGWTRQEGLAEEAAALAADGITVSVLATGEGPGEGLKEVADAGRGRFYPGRDLLAIPEIMMQEAVLASRSFVNEGEFFPRVTAETSATRGLESTPPILGYVATTAKPVATTVLDAGEEHDPLLATWRVGLGRATSWTSDASARWSQRWAGWDGYARFWSAVVKDTFPSGGAAGTSVRAQVSDDRLRVTIERDEPWPDGSSAVARVAGPDLAGAELAMERTSPTTFAGETIATAPGTYAVGAEVTAGGAAVFSDTALANVSYSPEYRPGPAEPQTLVRLSRASGGRGAIAAPAAFDPRGLPAGRAAFPLATTLIVLAALAWPAVVAMGRLSFHGAAPDVARESLARLGAAAGRVRARAGRRVARLRPHARGRPPAEPADPQAAPPTVRRLLERKRGD